MLTADLVRAYRRGDRVHLRPLKPAERPVALDLAGRYIALARGLVGQTRGELEDALAGVPVGARERKLALGLRKLVLDRCSFEVEEGLDPAALREQVFERAAALRRSAEASVGFDRDVVVAEVAREREISPDELERTLYADLRSAHRVLDFAAPGPRAKPGPSAGADEPGTEEAVAADRLLAEYETGQAQALLLRATWLRARVVSGSPTRYRALFHKLKFLRLLFRLEAVDGEPGGYELHVDGPYSMFRSVTKYGLQLALLLPSIQACERWSIEAEVAWGKRRTPVRFQLQGEAESAAEAPARSERLPDDVAALLERFQARDGPWQPAPTSDILTLPGIGLCVPDLVFSHRDTGECVYLEVLGYWSREAVWRRVELVEAGLPHKILFAVSSRLRVSEAVLGDDLPGGLYVYKGVMSARAVETRLDDLVARA
ncbi:DUF790 family protein [Haliangium sp.]|uniref:DUF790 family protein n=1 Tax=Haliangium sp. TaxID=2663208 RepID=UPI003D0EDDE9